MKKKRKVVVTTKSRPWVVLHGTLVSHEGDTVVLAGARCAVFYSAPTHGFAGLAVTGPANGSRISSAVDRAEISGVEAVLDATPEASAAWERGEWA